MNAEKSSDAALVASLARLSPDRGIECGRWASLQGRYLLLEVSGHQHARIGERCPVLFW